jgi:hypothetical protein
LREYWANVSGTYVAAIPLHTSPTSSTQLNCFEAPSNVADNYGQRVRGYICAPLTGNYTFYIASDDDAELWLSTDENVATKRKIASVSGWTYSREWTKYASQKSVAITLQANTKYYIEALHKEGAGGDRLAVGWTLPNASTIELIPGTVLSPFVPASAARMASTEPAPELSMLVYPNPSRGERVQVEIKGLVSKQQVKLTLYNSLGTSVYVQQMATDEAGTITKELRLLTTLSPGIYILQAETSDKTLTQRILIH